MSKTYKWFDYKLFLTKWYKEQVKKSKKQLYRISKKQYIYIYILTQQHYYKHSQIKTTGRIG